MRTHSVVVRGVICQQPTKLLLPQDQDMVEALASDRSDQSFSMAVLPWRSRSDGPISNAHGWQPTCDDGTVGAVAVTDQEAGCLILRKGFGDLPGDPLCGRVRCHVGPDESAPLQGENHQSIKKSEADSGNDEEINRRDVPSVIAQV